MINRLVLAIGFGLFSWVLGVNKARCGEVLVFVSESKEERVAVFVLDEADGGLRRVGERALPGAPGSLVLSADGRHLIAAVRSTRQVATMLVDAEAGTLGEPVLADLGWNAAYVHLAAGGAWLLSASYSEGVVGVSRVVDGVVRGEPVSRVETGKKAHSIQVAAGGGFALVPHVGELNKVEVLRFDAGSGMLSGHEPGVFPGGEGEGPRHLAFHPNGRWVYFVNEQGKSVTWCDWDAAAGRLARGGVLPTVPPEWDLSKGSCADIHVSEDGRFVYASNRGHDSLAMFAVNAESGALSFLGTVETEQTPRSFCLLPGGGYVVAAGEGNGRLRVFKRDAVSGLLEVVGSYECGAGPAWVTALRRSGGAR